LVILPKAIYMFSIIPIKIPMKFITEIKKFTLKFIGRHKRLWIAKAVLSKKRKARDITIPDFKLHHRAIVIKTPWYCHRNRYEDQWNRIEDEDLNPSIYAHLIFDKHTKNIWWKKKTGYSTTGAGKLDICLQQPETRSMFITLYSKCTKDLNIRPVTLQLVHKRTGNTLETIGIGKDFLSRSPY
jgi:uncharacterized protein (DUF736 family)